MSPSPHTHATLPSAANTPDMISVPRAMISEMPDPRTCPSNTETRLVPHSDVQMYNAGDLRMSVLANTASTSCAPTLLEASPTTSLGDGFARGWHKLPEELKLAIISYNLASDNPIHFLRNRAGDCSRTRTYLMRPELEKHLAMGPDIA